MNTVNRFHTRREFLVIAAGSALSACGAPSRTVPLGPATTSPSLAPSPTATTTSTPIRSQLPNPTHWLPNSGDLVPRAKVAAARHIESLGTDASHRVEVIEAQYGGLLSDSASVLVVCRSWTQTDSTLLLDGHTFDVRLAHQGAAWVVTAVNPSDPGVPAPKPSTAATQVLASDRIVLPPAARADVASGQVHDSALEAMLRMSQRWIIGVSVVRSGHPISVFGTKRRSDHPQGRAFDTWQIDGQPVVSPQTSRTLITNYMEALASLGSYNVGGPILLGSAPQFFSDQAHHDHVHAGFSR